MIQKSRQSFNLSDAEYSTSLSLNREETVNSLLLRAVLAIHQNSVEPSYSQVRDSFYYHEKVSVKWFLWAMVAARAAEIMEIIEAWLYTFNDTCDAWCDLLMNS